MESSSFKHYQTRKMVLTVKPILSLTNGSQQSHGSRLPPSNVMCSQWPRQNRQKLVLRWGQTEIVVVYVRYFFKVFVLFFVPPADSKGLSNPSEVEALREKVYASLEAYCKQKYPEQPGRYGDEWNRARPQTLVFREKRATHTHLERQSEAGGGGGSSVCLPLRSNPQRQACR